jgi:hypothetical protein
LQAAVRKLKIIIIIIIIITFLTSQLDTLSGQHQSSCPCLGVIASDTHNWSDVLRNVRCPCRDLNPGPSSPKLHHCTDYTTPTLQENAGAEIYG